MAFRSNPKEKYATNRIVNKSQQKKKNKQDCGSGKKEGKRAPIMQFMHVPIQGKNNTQKKLVRLCNRWSGTTREKKGEEEQERTSVCYHFSGSSRWPIHHLSSTSPHLPHSIHQTLFSFLLCLCLHHHYSTYHYVSTKENERDH